MTLDRLGLVFTVGIGCVFLVSCSSAKQESAKQEAAPAGGPVSRPFGSTQSGEAVELYTLTNSKGMEAAIMTYGGILVSLKVPGAAGRVDDVVLGFDTLDKYQSVPPPPYFGALIGRYGNRIGNAGFTLDGKEYKLAANNGKNSLHGGVRGFDKVVWKARTPDPHSLELTYVSEDGEEGYPGTLTSTVTYTVTDDNELKIDYHATTDKDTVLNLTNHSYFNLAGQGEGDVLGQQIMINADRITPVDSGLIPTGELKSVAGTPFDFRQSRVIGERINAPDDQLKFGKGYDMNYVLNRAGPGVELAARVTDPKSGRVMEVSTTQPAIQFYTGNNLDGSIKGKGGKTYPRFAALCLETQHYPDSPNKPSFPTTVLKPGEQYQTTTIYKFSANVK